MDNAPDSSYITQLLIAWSDGRREALDDLMPIVDADLKQAAAGLYGGRRPVMRCSQPPWSTKRTSVSSIRKGEVAQPRTLLWRGRRLDAADSRQGREEAASREARRGLEARDAGADEVAADTHKEIDVLALDEALERLAQFDPQQERIVELRVWRTDDRRNGQVVGISAATVVREWTIAKAWLRADLSRSG